LKGEGEGNGRGAGTPLKLPISVFGGLHISLYIFDNRKVVIWVMNGYLDDGYIDVNAGAAVSKARRLLGISRVIL